LAVATLALLLLASRSSSGVSLISDDTRAGFVVHADVEAGAAAAAKLAPRFDGGARIVNYMMLTSGATRLAINALESAVRHAPSTLQGLLVGVTSHHALREVERFLQRHHGVPSVRGVVLFNASELVVPFVDSEQAATVFEDSLYLHLMWTRMQSMQRIIAAGHTAVLMDVDMLLMRDLRPYLAPLANHRDLLAGACETVGRDNTLNTGVFIAGPQQLRIITDALALRPTYSTDQRAFQAMGPPLQRLCLPPDVVFLYAYSKPPAAAAKTTPLPLDPRLAHVIHFAGLSGSDAKVDVMKAMDMWYVE